MVVTNDTENPITAKPSNLRSEVGIVCAYKYWGDDDENDENDTSRGTRWSKSRIKLTESEEEDDRVSRLSCWQRIVEFYQHDSLLIDVAISIFIAWLWPPLGAQYCVPGVTAHWVAVIIIFFFSGLGLCISDLRRSSGDFGFNLFVGVFNFIGISTCVYYSASELFRIEVLSEGIYHGLIICSCLPQTTNMALVLTQSSGGDESSALFNATFWNLIGIFLTPMLIFYYLTETSNFDFGELYLKICLRVVFPVIVGIWMRYAITGLAQVLSDEKKRIKVLRERCLVFIIYTTFCETFLIEVDIDYGDFIVMVWFQIIELTILMFLAWVFLRLLFPRQYKKRVFGLFGCTHKSVALGIPLLTAIYGRDKNLGLYTLPLLVWYPTQLIFGTFMAPRLNEFVKYKESKERKLLEIAPMKPLTKGNTEKSDVPKDDKECEKVQI